MFAGVLLLIFLITSFVLSQGNPIKVLPWDDHIYHGVMPGFNGTEDSVTQESITEFVKKSGKLVAWINFSNNWYKGIKFPADEVKVINSLGSIPFIRLMPRSGYSKGKDKNFSLEKIINGIFDDELIKWAADAKKYGLPLMVDFAPEMNGSWFQWNGSYYGGGTSGKYGDKKFPDGPEKYRDAYRHIIDIFRNENVNNVTWVFHVNSYPDPDNWWNSYIYYYPGDDYIDWIGVSLYGPQDKSEGWRTFDEIMKEVYPKLTELSAVNPIGIFEIGIIDYPETGNKSQWIRDAFESLRNKKYPRIKSISWWNENFINSSGHLTNLKIDSSPESLKAYRESINYDIFTPYPNLSR